MEEKDLNQEAINEVNTLVEKAMDALKEFETFTQEQIDYIVAKCSVAGLDNHGTLAALAIEETKRGVFEDKATKNLFACEYVVNNMRHLKTVGIISQDSVTGITEIAEPVGVVAGLTPVTNPTSTAIFKSLICLKTRNPIIFAFHPKAQKCSVEAAKVVYEAAIKAGAPKDCIQWIEAPSMDATSALMNHPNVATILATGGNAMVKAAYSSGNPALGVGPGNTPAVIDETADIKMAVSSILMSKSFDNGMICASEQSVVVVDSIYEEVKKEFIYRGAYLVNDNQQQKLVDLPLIDPKRGTAHPDVVGQKPHRIAELAGFGNEVPEDAKILLVERPEVDWEDPFSREKLSPVLTLYRASDFEDATEKAYHLVSKGGAGHTSVLYTDERKKDRINMFGEKMPTCRVLINSPSSQGGIGDLFNFRLEPSLTLGCGSWGGNAVSGNVGVENLLNYKTVAERRENMLWFKVPSKVYFKRGATDLALRELEGKKRAFIVTDRFLFNSGAVNAITNVLDEIGIEHEVFFDVKPDPTLSTIDQAMAIMKPFEPDVIISLGGGSPMDAAKIM